MRKNRPTNPVGAILAVLAMLGFLAVVAVLATTPIPAGNKDYFNTALIALVGLVGTAFGYFLGSSAGSSRKTELLGNDPWLTPIEGAEVRPISASIQSTSSTKSTLDNEGGFTLVECVLLLGICVSLGLLLITASGCATLQHDTPEALAGKSLLTMKATIVTAATAGDALCKKQVIPETDCRALANYYHQAQPAYDLAVDSLNAVLYSKDPALWQGYQGAQQKFRAIFDDIIILSGQYGLLGGAQ